MKSPRSISCWGCLAIIAGAFSLLSAASASAYELRLIRQIDPAYGSQPADIVALFPLAPGALVTYDLYLDTQGKADILAIGAGIVFDPAVITYRSDLSVANDYYPLYAPAGGKGEPATWLEPARNPPELWPGNEPAPGLQQVSVDMLSNLFAGVNPTTGTGTNVWLATIAFEVVLDETDFGSTSIELTLDNGLGTGFFIEAGTGVVDVGPTVNTQIAWAPEPSTALLLGVGLAGLAWRRR